MTTRTSLTTDFLLVKISLHVSICVCYSCLQNSQPGLVMHVNLFREQADLNIRRD